MVIKLDPRHKKLDGDLLLTVACPVECDFCVYSCTASKEPWKWMPEETIRRVAEEYTKNDIGIRIGGGEPFYDLNRLKRALDIILEYQKPYEVLIISSGYFAITEEEAKRHLKVITDHGLDWINISSDRFHLKNVPLKNIENILKVSKDLGLNVGLRITIDQKSVPLIDKLTELIAKYQPKIELHNWGAFGRGEKLNREYRRNWEGTMNYFKKKLKENAQIYNVNEDITYYFAHFAKRKQLDYSPNFFPTTFPNGEVYGDSMAAKWVYMGNINNENLSNMIEKFKKTLPGHYLIGYKTSCSPMSKLISPNLFKDMYGKCELCMNLPFKENWTKYYVGRRYVVIDPSTDIEKKFDDIRNEWRELLVSVQPKEELNHIFGKKVEEFIKLLIKYNKRFVFSRPIPSCLGIDKNLLKKFDDYQLPKNCWECRELFTVENGNFVACPNIFNINLGSINEFGDRKEIYDKFMEERGKINGGLISKKCKGCIFRIRNNCGCNGVKK